MKRRARAREHFQQQYTDLSRRAQGVSSRGAPELSCFAWPLSSTRHKHTAPFRTAAASSRKKERTATARGMHIHRHKTHTNESRSLSAFWLGCYLFSCSSSQIALSAVIDYFPVVEQKTQSRESHELVQNTEAAAAYMQQEQHPRARPGTPVEQGRQRRKQEVLGEERNSSKKRFSSTRRGT